MAAFLLRERWARGALTAAATALALSLLPTAAQGQDEPVPEAACPVDAPESDFDDRASIPGVHVSNVDCGAFFDIVLGFEDGTFGPTLSVKRDQMASFIARSLDSADVELPDVAEGRDFDDVADGNVHRDNIRRLEAAGITLGGPLGASEDEFGPRQSIRRDQMVSFIVRAAEFAFGQDFDSFEQQFDDVGSDNVHFENVNFAAEAALAVGREDGDFDPGEDTRRDQTSAFVVRLLNFLTTPAEVAITEQSAEQATVAETITVTATVFSQFRDEAAETASDTDSATLEGVEVTFEGEHEDDAGQVVPPGTQTEETNEDGEASFDVTAAPAGTVTITASIAGPGGTFLHADGDADSVEKEFLVDPAVEPGGLPDDEEPPADDEEPPADDAQPPADDGQPPADDPALPGLPGVEPPDEGELPQIPETETPVPEVPDEPEAPDEVSHSVEVSTEGETRLCVEADGVDECVDVGADASGRLEVTSTRDADAPAPDASLEECPNDQTGAVIGLSGLEAGATVQASFSGQATVDDESQQVDEEVGPLEVDAAGEASASLCGSADADVGDVEDEGGSGGTLQVPQVLQGLLLA